MNYCGLKYHGRVLYRSPNTVRAIKSRQLRCAEVIARMDEGGSDFNILTCKSTGKRPLWRSRLRWEDYITMELKEIGINTRNWVDSAQDRNYWISLVKAALNLRVP